MRIKAKDDSVVVSNTKKLMSYKITHDEYGFTNRSIHYITALNNTFRFKYNTVLNECGIYLNIYPMINIHTPDSYIELNLGTIGYNNFGEFKISKIDAENNPKINKYKLVIEGSIFVIAITYLDKGNIMVNVEVDNLAEPVKFKINLTDKFKTQKFEQGYINEYDHRIYSVDKYVCGEKLVHESTAYDFITLFNKNGFAIFTSMRLCMIGKSNN